MPWITQRFWQDDGTGSGEGSWVEEQVWDGSSNQTPTASDLAYMSEQGMTPEEIASATGLTSDQINSISSSAYTSGNATTPALWDQFLKKFQTDGTWDLSKILGAGLTLAAVTSAYRQATQPHTTGYTEAVPIKEAVRSQTAAQDPNVRPGAGGHRYMTDTGYADPKDVTGLAALKANIATQKAEIEAQNKLNDTAQLERQRIANLPNEITPNQFYGLVAQTPMTDAQKVKVPGATINTLPAGQFTPEAYKPTTVVGGDTGIPTTVTGNADSPWTTAQVASYIRDQQLTPAQQLQAAAAFHVPQWQMDAANALLKSKDLTSVDAQSMDYARKVMIDPRLEAQNNADEAKAGLGWAYQAPLNTYSPKQLGVTVTGAMLDPTSATYRPDLAQGAKDLRSAMTTMNPADATALYKSKQDAYGFTDADFNKYAPATPAYVAPTSIGLQATSDVMAARPDLQAAAGQLRAAMNTMSPEAATALYNQKKTDFGFSDADFNKYAPVQAAQGGLMGLARGGQPNAPRYLQGNTDGMADKIPAQIDGHQPAALAHGEFVVPADVVSHLGNGNSDAGADVLYKMMDKIRKARTGNKKQGKQIDPNKFTPGGLAYAAGGSVKHFVTGGTTLPAGAVGMEENLSNWAGPYVQGMLSQGAALANAPYQAYQGPLTAGDSALQTQGYQNAAALQTPTSIGTAANTAENVATNFNTLANAGYPTSQAVNQFTVPGAYQGSQNTSAMFGNDQAQAYMNPYLQQSLNPQLQEARRQSQISQQTNNAQATQAGAFGGARQGIMAAENQRNLGSNLANITGQGYNTAYNNAQQQFNADQARLQAAQAANEQSRQFGANFGMTGAQQSAQYGQAAQAQNEASNQFSANYGLQALQGQLSAANAQGNLGATQNQAGLANLQAQLAAGSTQQATAQAGVAADQAAFNAERDNPYKMVQYQQSLLAGLPITAQSYNIQIDPIAAMLQAGSGASSTTTTPPH